MAFIFFIYEKKILIFIWIIYTTLLLDLGLLLMNIWYLLALSFIMMYNILTLELFLFNLQILFNVRSLMLSFYYIYFWVFLHFILYSSFLYAEKKIYFHLKHPFNMLLPLAMNPKTLSKIYLNCFLLFFFNISSTWLTIIVSTNYFVGDSLGNILINSYITNNFLYRPYFPNWSLSKTFSHNATNSVSNVYILSSVRLLLKNFYVVIFEYLLY